MAWFKMHQELARHPKLKRFARGLGISEPTAIGHLFLLWSWAMDYAQDGDLSQFSEDDIAFAMQWGGDPPEMIEALLSCGVRGYGFLEHDDNGHLILHNWEEHCGARFRQRAQGTERIRRHREKQARNASVTRYTCVSNAAVTRGEERRGDEKRGEEIPPLPPPGGVRAGVESPAPKSPEAGQPETSLPAERPQESGGARPNTDGKEAEPPAAFAVFWAAYPRKVQKQTALKAWRTLVKQGASDADILNAAGAYQTASARKHTPPDKIMHPATFLREDRWRDWLPPDGASYREAIGAASGQHLRRGDVRPMTYAEALKRYRGGADGSPITYAEAVESLRGPGAVTVDVAPEDWKEGAGNDGG